jgi:hypothetical protein
MRSAFLGLTAILASSFAFTIGCDEATADQAAAVATPAAAAPAPAAPGFKVGDKITYEWAGHPYPGTLAEIKEERGKTWYRVKYDDTTQTDTWTTVDRLRRADAPKPREANLDPNETFGTWSLGTVTQTTDHRADKDVTTITGYAFKETVTIRPDNTYTWNLDAKGDKKIEGKWRLEPNPRTYRGPVVLEKAYGDQDWWVQYYGENHDGSDNLYLARADGIRYFGSKPKGGATTKPTTP